MAQEAPEGAVKRPTPGSDGVQPPRKPEETFQDESRMSELRENFLEAVQVILVGLVALVIVLRAYRAWWISNRASSSELSNSWGE